ncbi:MAG: fluoride efflux transporter CrcB [Gammaproteobacteria bacterium]|nr:fluoride efflux transporter CrcB [Gammaproteobacteria bacterium]MCW5582453.1 fluoride efflux transporter CrcB [Gammaproteobacteria bacterium]
MLDTLLIFVGAGCGGVFRYWISNISYWFLGRQFPYGTLIVNVSGCFLMGLLFILLIERFNGLGSQLRSLLLIGLLGGYTTFSSFSIETLNLFENGAFLSGVANILLSIILCLAATWLGVIGGRQL